MKQSQYTLKLRFDSHVLDIVHYSHAVP